MKHRMLWGWGTENAETSSGNRTTLTLHIPPSMEVRAFNTNLPMQEGVQQSKAEVNRRRGICGLTAHEEYSGTNWRFRKKSRLF